MAEESVSLKPDILLSRSTPMTEALRRATGVIPIVFVNVAGPVEQQFADSLARPAGNLTGFTNFQSSVGGKMLQLLKQIDPRLLRVAVMYNPQTAPFSSFYLRSVESVAPELGVQVSSMPVHSEGDIETAIAAFARQSAAGLVLTPDSFTANHRERIVALVAQNHLPTIYSTPRMPFIGGLMSYAVDSTELMHRAAEYLDRILRGAKPAELPVQQPTGFKFVINRKVAEALGLTISPQLYIFADEVIE